MTDSVQRQELGSFLRARREATDPAVVGIPGGGRRRTPGLRREEVAQLAGVSHTWYTWLEQGRDIGVSRQVFESIARVLRLDGAERLHLFRLAGLAVSSDRTVRVDVDDTLRRLIEALDPHPAYVASPWWDLLAYNTAYGALLGPMGHRAVHERNILWLMFTDPAMKRLFVDWKADARQLVGQLRIQRANHPDDPRGRELIDDLLGASVTFSELWKINAVATARGARKRLRHATAGTLTLDYVKLLTSGDDEQQVIVFLPADPASASQLITLAPA